MIYNRKLGCLEQVMEILNSRAKTWNIVTISRIKGHICEENLAQALDVIQCRHPRLNSQIIRSTNSLSFQNQGTAKIALRVVRHLNNEQWQEVVYEEMNKEIDSSQGLLRVVLVHLLGDEHISYLITTIHHAIADGLSSIRLHSEILTWCERIVSGEPIHPVTSLTPLPPIEQLMPEWTKGFRGKINSIIFLLQLGFQKIWNQPKTLGFHKYVSIAKRTSNIIHRQLDQDLTQKFVNHCRQEKTTVHSALCAVLMFTVARKIIKGNRKDVRVNCLSYFDLRRYLEPAISDDRMAVLASSAMGFHTIRRNMSIWELAREVKQKLEFSKESGDLFKMILIAKHLIYFCFIFPKQVAATVSVSNVGKVNVPTIYGEFELEEISFAGSNALYAGLFVIHASTFKGKMLLNFVFSQPSIDQNDMEILVNNVMSYILDICNLNINYLLTLD
ncbi:alcohol acetyltransferase [Nostoc sp. UCD121]|uniref:phthiocerol/phthiodiolone dimycocerosyl transferase family protein n=1 Tax=unclassified Nostoc TaxID=2593658 RepID=UPI00162523CB|nr:MULTISPECIES: condensation domain-containing protein [unclassified Nostoc]MBC1219225.1 alcohol acetyltransferase [Nostoc sp. UCD120]MBC1274624.1 alcohol acetyltransferase [Nostoc sp. UCD121]MBC1295495.1 alcohol acetyltransferase [Nostoc sp. UCD122]